MENKDFNLKSLSIKVTNLKYGYFSGIGEVF